MGHGKNKSGNLEMLKEKEHCRQDYKYNNKWLKDVL